MWAAWENFVKERESQGWAKGRAEGVRANSLETAQRMIARGKMPLDEIAELTNLSLAEVEALSRGKSA